MSTFIQVSNLKFSFPNTNKQLLNIVDLNINQGEKIFLHGPSGCGKSTFLEIVSGVLSFNQGDVVIGENSLVKMSPRQKDQ